MKTTSQSRIFISYSHRGNGPAWKAALLRALHVFERHHLLDDWQDGKIRNRSIWNDDIQQAMTSAQLAVALLTKERSNRGRHRIPTTSSKRNAPCFASANTSISWPKFTFTSLASSPARILTRWKSPQADPTAAEKLIN
jgi:hypothetical protein